MRGVHTQPPSRLLRRLIKRLIVEVAVDNSSLHCLRNAFSISSSEIPQVPTVGNWQKEGVTERERGMENREKEEEEGDKGESKRSGEDRKVLDGEDGKFGERRPIFNSGFQATDEQQGRKGWRAREGPRWATIPHVDQL